MILLLFLKPALVLGAAALITALLRYRSAALRHAMWAGSIIALLALPILSGLLPPIRMSRPVLLQEPAAPATLNSSRSTTTPVSQSAIPMPAWQGDGALAARLPALLVAIWIAGAVLVAGRRVVFEVQVARIVRRARRVRSHDGADIRLSAEVSSPAVAGLLRPVVLLPEAATTWTEAERAAVLAHELAHIARRDGAFNFCGELAKAIYWCNPAVYFAVQRMRAESEKACDDRALLAGSAPEDYAQLLLAIARTAGAVGLPRAAIAMARPRELEARLLAVLDPRVPRVPPRRALLAGMVATAVLLTLPAAALTLQAVPAREPDTLGDALASPLSERLPRQDTWPDAAAVLRGPDSVLARALAAAVNHQPEGDWDLVRDRATWALAQAQGARLIEPLIAALRSEDWRVQAYAAWALAVAHDSRAVPNLIPLLRHPVWRLRAMAAFALRRSLDPRAETAMNAALDDPAWQVRTQAVEYFGEIGGPKLQSRLTSRLKDRHAAVRLAAQRALTSHSRE